MNEEETKKYMTQIQDILLDLQLEGKIDIEEITTHQEEDGTDITTIRIQPILKSQEEVDEFYRRAKMLGYVKEPIEENSDSDPKE
jgi:hypothetical protein